MSRNRNVEFLSVLFIASFLVFAVFITTEPLTPQHWLYSSPGDHFMYRAMAEEPFAPHHRPFCYRILIPWMVSVFPDNFHPTVFQAQTVLFLIGTTILIYYIIRSLKFQRSLAIGGMMFFVTIEPGVKFLLFDFWLTDAAAFFFITLIIYLTLREYSVPLTVLTGLVFFLGVLSKESVLLVAPLCYTFRAKKFFDSKAALWATVVIIPGLLAFEITRMFIAGDSPYDSYITLVNNIGIPRITKILPNELKFYTFYTFGVSILVLPAFAPSKNLKLALVSLPFLLLVFGQVLIATSIDRLIVVAFPIAIIAAVTGIQALCRYLKVTDAIGLTIPLMEFGFVFLFMLSFMDPNIPTRDGNEERIMVARIFVLIFGLMTMLLIADIESRRNNLKKTKRKHKKPPKSNALV